MTMNHFGYNLSENSFQVPPSPSHLPLRGLIESAAYHPILTLSLISDVDARSEQGQSHKLHSK